MSMNFFNISIRIIKSSFKILILNNFIIKKINLVNTSKRQILAISATRPFSSPIITTELDVIFFTA